MSQTRRFACLLVVLVALAGFAPVVLAGSHDSILHIGTKSAPPFAMKTVDGNWQGISIELWQEIAKRLKLSYVWEERDLESLLSGVEKAELDASIAAFTITAEREKRLDFSHAYYSTGLSIAIPRRQGSGWQTILRGLFSKRMLTVVLALLAVLGLVGTLAWLFERKNNPQSFDPSPVRGIGGGIWWAAVTMTTVGYGDMTPKTLGGRLIALLWMFASLLLLSTAIAAVSSALTVSKMEPLVSGPEDLARARIASIENSTSDQYLKSRRLPVKYYGSVAAGLTAIERNEADAMVYDRPLLQYLVNKDFAASVTIDDHLFERQQYGIAFPEGSPLREQVNRVMLEIIQQDSWKKAVSRYLGD